MPRAESSNNAPDEREEARRRTTALIALLITSLLGIATWFALNRAADAGIARLARIDRVRAVCDSGWREARDQRDSMLVDLISLPDTIDRGSSSELSRCGNLRPNGMPTARAGTRDLTVPERKERQR